MEADMTNQEIKGLLDSQRAYYRSGATIPVKFRIEQLKKLYAAVKKYQNEINDPPTLAEIDFSAAKLAHVKPVAL